MVRFVGHTSGKWLLPKTALNEKTDVHDSWICKSWIPKSPCSTMAVHQIIQRVKKASEEQHWYNLHHKTHPLLTVQSDKKCGCPKRKSQGIVLGPTTMSRSYILEIDEGLVRRKVHKVHRTCGASSKGKFLLRYC